MNLPKRVLAIISVSSFLLLLSFTPVFASNPQPITNPPENGVSSSVSAVDRDRYASLDESGEVLFGMDDIGDFFKGIGGNIIDTALDVVKKGAHVVMDVFIEDSTGCSGTDKACQEKQHAEMLNNMPVSEMSNPGAVHLLAGGLDSMLTMPIPINSGTYFASINPFKQARATGFDELTASGGLLKLWVLMRNSAYALTVVALVIIGIMIMLRVPLNPRTVVTAQNSIPRLALGLILITFSFALSGLLIDFGRVALNLVQWLYGQVGINWEIIALKLAGFIVFSVDVGFLVGGPGGALLILLIIVFFLLFIIFYLLFKLIARYAQFLVLTILSPFVFLISIIPGLEGTATSWFKRQLSNILAAPVILFMVGLALVIVNTSIPTPLGLSNPLNLVSFYGGGFIAIGILFAATRAPEMLDDMLGLKQGPSSRAGITGAAIGGTVITMNRMGVSSWPKKIWRRTPMRDVWETLRGRPARQETGGGQLIGYTAYSQRGQEASGGGGNTEGTGSTEGLGSGSRYANRGTGPEARQAVRAAQQRRRAAINRVPPTQGEPGEGPAQNPTPPRTGEPPEQAT